MECTDRCTDLDGKMVQIGLERLSEDMCCRHDKLSNRLSLQAWPSRQETRTTIGEHRTCLFLLLVSLFLPSFLPLFPSFLSLFPFCETFTKRCVLKVIEKESQCRCCKERNKNKRRLTPSPTGETCMLQPGWVRTSLRGAQVTAEKKRQGSTPLSHAVCQCVVLPTIHGTRRIDFMEQNWQCKQTHIQVPTLSLILWAAQGKQCNVCDCLVRSTVESQEQADPHATIICDNMCED